MRLIPLLKADELHWRREFFYLVYFFSSSHGLGDAKENNAAFFYVLFRNSCLYEHIGIENLGTVDMRNSLFITTLAIAGLSLSACGVHKVVTVPAKAAVGTTKFVGKAAVGTTKVVGKTAVGGTKMVGKGLWATGKGVYYVGSVPVKITDAALTTTARLLSITTQVVDLTGSVVTVTRTVNATRLEAELAGLKTATNVLSVVVDVAT